MSVQEKLVRFARKSPSDRWAAGKAMLRDEFCSSISERPIVIRDKSGTAMIRKSGLVTSEPKL
jgi:hypothetical protein